MTNTKTNRKQNDFMADVLNNLGGVPGVPDQSIKSGVVRPQSGVVSPQPVAEKKVSYGAKNHPELTTYAQCAERAVKKSRKTLSQIMEMKERPEDFDMWMVWARFKDSQTVFKPNPISDNILNNVAKEIKDEELPWDRKTEPDSEDEEWSGTPEDDEDESDDSDDESDDEDDEDDEDDDKGLPLLENFANKRLWELAIIRHHLGND